MRLDEYCTIRLGSLGIYLTRLHYLERNLLSIEYWEEIFYSYIIYVLVVLQI
jgi:hypothetical protein